MNLRLLPRQLTLEHLPFLLTALAMWGTAFAYRDFVRLRVGPIFILEVLAFCLVASLFWQERRDGWRSWCENFFPLPTLILFGAWGFLLVAMDLAGPVRSIPLGKTLQYCILFVYPPLWLGLGHWFAKRFPHQLSNLIYGVVICATIAAFLFFPSYDARLNLLKIDNNIALGPLVLTLAFYFLNRSKFLLNKDFCLGVSALLLAYAPSWLLWGLSMQRTSLVLLIAWTIAIPFILQPTLKKAIAMALGALTLYTAGALLFLALQSNKGSASAQAIHALNHSDDTINSDPNRSPSLFQGRFRGFLWQQALAEWRESPWRGIGFARVMPKFIGPGAPNDGSASAAVGFTPEPVSGPHNSYLGILTRMGIVGFSLFLLAGLHWFWRVRTLVMRPENLSDLILTVLVFSGLFYALLNIGFESPHNSLILWFAAGALLFRARSARAGQTSI